MLLTQGVIEELAAQLLLTSVRSACEAAGVSVGSYYRWHWESRRLSRRRLPDAVDTPYEKLIRKFGRVTRRSRKKYLARRKRGRVKSSVYRQGTLPVRVSRKRVGDLCKVTASLTSANFDF